MFVLLKKQLNVLLQLLKQILAFLILRIRIRMLIAFNQIWNTYDPHSPAAMRFLFTLLTPLATQCTTNRVLILTNKAAKHAINTTKAVYWKTENHSAPSYFGIFIFRQGKRIGKIKHNRV